MKSAPTPGTYVNKNNRHATSYIRICRGPQRDVYVHTLVMEAKLGRKLEAHETVEHRDGNKQNNSPENLIMVSRPENTALMLQRNGSPLASKAMAKVGGAAFAYGANAPRESEASA